MERKYVVLLSSESPNDKYAMEVKDYDQIMPQADALNSYNSDGKRNKLMEYFSNSLYPVMQKAEFKKSMFKKIYLIKIDSFDLRMILDK